MCMNGRKLIIFLMQIASCEISSFPSHQEVIYHANWGGSSAISGDIRHERESGE